MKSSPFKILVALSVCFAGVVFMRPIIVDRLDGAALLANNRTGAASASFFSDIALKYLQESLQSYGGNISATLEKQSAATKETLQGDLNYQGSVEMSKGAAISDEKFADEESLDVMCAVAEDQNSVINAKISSDMWAKAIVTTNLNSRLAAPTKAAVVDRALAEHNENYCTDEDSIRGRCLPSGKGMPNADIDVGTMLHPNFASTLSNEEYEASLAATKKIVGTMPIVDLPATLEKSPGGQAYLLEKRRSEARLSLANFAFAQVIARRRSREDAN